MRESGCWRHGSARRSALEEGRVTAGRMGFSGTLESWTDPGHPRYVSMKRPVTNSLQNDGWEQFPVPVALTTRAP